jgi:very-short-patch-repair endonuclease
MNNNPLDRKIVIDKISQYGYKPINKNFVYINQETKIPCYDWDGYIVNVAYARLGKVKNFLRFDTKSNLENFVYNANILGSKLNNKSKVVNVYKTSKDKIRKNSRIVVGCICDCGEYFETDWAEWRMGRKSVCEDCITKYSKLEMTVRKFLDWNHIASIYQYKFDDCVLKKCLPFDFFCPMENLCIEVDGEQHRKPRAFNGGDKAFENIQSRDNIKTQYCKNKNIALLRITNKEIINGKYRDKILKATNRK